MRRSPLADVAPPHTHNQVGVLFGSPDVTAGGNALKYYASIRMDIRRKSPIKRGDVVEGYETKVKVVKNKLAPPFREVRRVAMRAQ